MNRVDGKVALISGAARGIGAETARALAAAGAKIVITDLMAKEGEATAAELRAGGAEAAFVGHDATSEASWREAVGFARQRFGGIDVLVNNAGLFFGKGIEDTSLEDYHRLFAVNVDGVFLGMKIALPALRERAHLWPGGASIVNLSSVAGLVGSQLDAPYSSSKGAVRLLTKGGALEFGRKGYRVRVNSVHPGVIQTDMGDIVFRARAGSGAGGINDALEAGRKAAMALHPIGRLGEARDIANAILFLASDDSSFMTGSELVVDGGYTAQ